MTQPDEITLLARRMATDINVGSDAAPDWQRLFGIEEFKPVRELRTEDDEEYADDGESRELVTGRSTRLELKVKSRKGTDTEALNPVHAFLIDRFENSVIDQAGSEFGVRYYGRDGIGDAIQGRAYVKQWAPEGGNSGAKDTVSVQLQFQGKTSRVANPAGVLTPTVTALVPAGGGTAGGNLVTIKGSKFTGVTGAAGVKFGATNAAQYTVLDDTRIVAEAPAGTAGAKDVTVTNAAGTSPTAGDGNDYTYA
ncbi:phage tail tube protein [Actinoplanes sp. CA-054009]